MRKPIFLFFFVLHCNSFGQQYVDSTFTRDVNTDGILDTITFLREYGSGFGGTEYKITNGKTKEVFELSNYSSYGTTKLLIPVPTVLLKKANEGFLEVFKKELLPKKRTTPDASLQWIIDATYTSRKLDDSCYFEEIFTPGSEWSTNTFEPQSNYYLEVHGDSISRLSDGYPPKQIDSANSKNSSAFLVYFGSTVRDGELFVDRRGNPQGGLIPVIENKTYKIFKTKHSILARKGDTYKWLFITDGGVTGAPQKLRWPSIDKILLKKGYLIFKQEVAPDPEYNVYVIHIESGALGRLKIDFDTVLGDDTYVTEMTEEEELSVKGNTIVIGIGKQAIRIPLKKIKRIFEAL